MLAVVALYKAFHSILIIMDNKRTLFSHSVRVEYDSSAHDIFFKGGPLKI